jgi:hypothetical protein
MGAPRHATVVPAVSGYRIQNLVWENSRARGLTKLVLLAIAKHCDQDGIAWPGSGTVAELAGIDRSNVFDHIKRLVAMGELEVLTRGGGRKSTRYRVITADAKQPDLIPRRNGHVGDGAATPPQRGGLWRTDTTGAPRPVSQRHSSRRDVTTAGVSHRNRNHVIEPTIEPIRGTARAPRAALEKRPTPKDETREQLKMAKALWLEARGRKRLARFTDGKATRGLRVSVRRALDQGVEWRDIEAGIRAHATDEKANPWYADEWARTAAGDRREAERIQEKMRERAQDDERWARRRGELRPIGDVIGRAR